MYTSVTEAYQRLLSYQISEGPNKGAFSYSNRRMQWVTLEFGRLLLALFISNVFPFQLGWP